MRIRPFGSATVLSFCLIVSAALLWLQPSAALSASSDIRIKKGQTLYVPVYSNVFAGPTNRPFQLAATLSIRNTDIRSSLKVTLIDYFDTKGAMVRRYLDKPVLVGPMATIYIHLEEKDTAGGFGANFLVKWQSDSPINAPIVECVMIGTTGGQGISFISPAQEIQEKTK